MKKNGFQGGYKLDAVIKKFNVKIKNKVCMDIGCSMRISDVLIKEKAKRFMPLMLDMDNLNGA